jgi:hypothetical protein
MMPAFPEVADLRYENNDFSNQIDELYHNIYVAYDYYRM